ncbi:MAG: ATP-binding protein [Myxococcota bacterium]
MQPKPDSLVDFREYPILYVDDEPDNLRIFELTFRREFAIYTATSGDEGLEILATKPVALVLSDHRMPGMTGTEFLVRAAELDPATVRIMVTAYGDVATLQEAINRGAIYRFIPKPWEPADVRATLMRGIEAYALDRERAQLLNELQILSRVSAAMNRELEIERLLDLLIRTLREDMSFDGASVLLRDRRNGSLSWARPSTARDEIDVRLEGLSFTHENAGDFLTKLEDGMSLTLKGDRGLEYRGAVRTWVTEVAADEILVTPLYGKEGLLGAITVDNRSGGARFSADDVTMIEGLASQASVAVENARLVEDLRRSREQMRRADRLGTLASGLAQEIEEPLTSLRTFVEQTSKSGEEKTQAQADLSKIERLVDTMQRVGRGAAGTSREAVSLGDVVGEVVSMLQREAHLGRIMLRWTGEPDMPKLVAVRDQLHQVVLNLVLNALAVTPEGGEISVRTRAAYDESGVELSVTDTGPGLAAEQLEQIFDPFLAGEDADANAGLGLLVCQRIVTEHGGTLEVQDGEGRGSRFVVRLPVGDTAGA